jgi:hypothetical protein
MAAGAVLDKALTELFADAAASREILMAASGNDVLRKDLRPRKAKNGFVPGLSVSQDADQREALLMTAFGEPDPVISRRFLMERADTAKLRSAITSRYRTLFSWLQDFRRAALAIGFAEHGGSRKYLAGRRSSDVDKRNGRSGWQSDGLQDTKTNDGKAGAGAVMTKRRDEDTLPDCSSGELPLDRLRYQLSPSIARSIAFAHGYAGGHCPNHSDLSATGTRPCPAQQPGLNECGIADRGSSTFCRCAALQT